MRQQMLKTRAQVLWLEGTFDFQQHSDVTFQMHSYHSDDGEIDPAPFQVWGEEEKRKRQRRFLKQKPMLSLPLKNRLLFLAILIKALYSFLFVFF